MSRALHLNETVCVRLTPEGQAVWSRNNDSQPAPLFIRCQLWQLMNWFGPSMYVGAHLFEGDIEGDIKAQEEPVEVLVWRWYGNPQTAEFGTPEIYRVRAEGKERYVHSSKIIRYLRVLKEAGAAQRELESEKWEEGSRVP